jgi:hypothetical protein
MTPMSTTKPDAAVWAGPEVAATAVPPARPLPFAPPEVAAFRAEDRAAATAIVGIMAGIFTLGLIGYVVICFLAAH